MCEVLREDTLIEVSRYGDTAPYWHGMQGRILRPAGDSWPDMYIVKMVNGSELHLKSSEFEVIRRPDYPNSLQGSSS